MDVAVERDPQVGPQSSQVSSSTPGSDIGNPFADPNALPPHVDPLLVGREQVDKPLPLRTFLVVISVTVVIGFLLWLTGQLGRSGWAQWLRNPTLQSFPMIQVIDARPDRVLMLESNGIHTRVLIQETNDASWLLVSRDDYTAVAPVLAPDGEAVAYRSAQGSGDIVAVSLISATRMTLGASSLQPINPNLKVCDWTPIAWSPNSTQLAFYACDSQLNRSILVWTPTAAAQPQTVVSTEVSSVDPRQVQWLNDNQVVVTVPAMTRGDSQQVLTYDVK